MAGSKDIQTLDDLITFMSNVLDRLGQQVEDSCLVYFAKCHPVGDFGMEMPRSMISCFC